MPGAATADQTDWAQIVELYGLLLRIESSPVIELKSRGGRRDADGPQAGLHPNRSKLLGRESWPTIILPIHLAPNYVAALGCIEKQFRPTKGRWSW